MGDLLNHLKSCDLYEPIIISDSNSVFIEMILQHLGQQDCFRSVYTNPAQFNDSGVLQIEYYHTQDWCDLSTVNLCKGHILQEHIKAAASRPTPVIYKTVLYVGDGNNDFCPGLRLKNSDYLCARAGYSLVKKIQSATEQKVQCQTLIYNSGSEIVNLLKKLEQNT